MQCITSFNKNSLLSTFNICIYSCLRSNSSTVFSTLTHFGTFHPAQLVRMCWIASETSTWNKQFKRWKKKDDQTNLNKEGVFHRWNVFSLRLTIKVIKCNSVFWFGLYRKYKEETEGFQKRLNTSLHVVELFQFPPVANWNFSFTHTHMELRHAVATHQWTRNPV